MLQLQGTQDAATRRGERPCREDALKSESAHRDGGFVGDAIQVAQVNGADRSEVALVRVVRPLGVLNVRGQLRDHEIEIRVSLAVRVGGVIDRYAVHADRKVGTVVEVVAAEQILIRLTLAAVRGHLQAGNGLEQLAGTKGWRERQLIVDHDAFAGGAGGPNQLPPRGRDDDLVQGA